MSIINTLLENEDFQNYMKENEEIFNEAEQDINDFGKTMKSFILANPTEFLAENIEQTKKNIRVFTEVATAQYITEVSNIVSKKVKPQETEELSEGETDTVDDYF